MAIKQTKVTDEELKQISEFQTSIDRITIDLGQLALKKLSLDKEEEYLESEYEKILVKEKQLGDNLKENSKVVEKTLVTSKNLVGPLSKSLDYLVVSILTIFVYNYYNNYMK